MPFQPSRLRIPYVSLLFRQTRLLRASFLHFWPLCLCSGSLFQLVEMECLLIHILKGEKRWCLLTLKKKPLKNFSKSWQIQMHPWRNHFPIILGWNLTLPVYFWACFLFLVYLIPVFVFKGKKGEGVYTPRARVSGPVHNGLPSLPFPDRAFASWARFLLLFQF